MSDFFEFRDDPVRAQATAGYPKQLCALKWEAEKQINHYIRKRAENGDHQARQLSALLDQVGITPDFEPSEVGRA